jgi:hypothetical protein
VKNAIVVFFVFFAFITGAQEQAFSRDSYEYYPRYAADDQIINRPVNMQGLTGLLFTNSAYTQPAGSVTFGLAGLAEDSSEPEYSVAQATASLTIGLSDRVEAAVRGKMFGRNFGSSAVRETGMGDTDLLLKWRFSSQGENLPALAFGFGWTFPTGEDDKGFTEAKYESVRIMVMAAGENRVLDDGFIGIYMEAQAVFNDQLHKDSDSPYKDKYGVVNAGILFPLSDDNHLQLMLEYTRVLKKEFQMLYDRNYTGIVPGLRYVTENFSLTLGLQKISRDDSGPAADEKANRIAGAVNYRF